MQCVVEKNGTFNGSARSPSNILLKPAQGINILNHIIPLKTLNLFWNTLFIKHKKIWIKMIHGISQKQFNNIKNTGKADFIHNANGTITSGAETFSENNIFMAIARLSKGKETTLEERNVISSLYHWLPGNLSSGKHPPGADPKDNFDKVAAQSTNDRYASLYQLWQDMENYITSKDEQLAQKCADGLVKLCEYGISSFPVPSDLQSDGNEHQDLQSEAIKE